MRSRRLLAVALLAIPVLSQSLGTLAQYTDPLTPQASVEVDIDGFSFEIFAFSETAQDLADLLKLGRGTDPIRFGQQMSMFIMDNLDIMAEVEANLELPVCTSLYDTLTTGPASDLVRFAEELLAATYSRVTSTSPPQTVLDLSSFECATSCSSACLEGVSYSLLEALTDWDDWRHAAACALRAGVCVVRTAACFMASSAAVTACGTVCAAPPWLQCAVCIVGLGAIAVDACVGCIDCWKEWSADCP